MRTFHRYYNNLRQSQDIKVHINNIQRKNIRDLEITFKYIKRNMQRKTSTTKSERNTRIQSFPSIVPAVNQDPVNINMQNQNY